MRGDNTRLVNILVDMCNYVHALIHAIDKEMLQETKAYSVTHNYVSIENYGHATPMLPVAL